jgi:hypothetical protein
MSLRAGPLSDDQVIALLNKFFVPVYAPYTSEETAGIVSSEEEREIQRIWRESLERKTGYGMVHVYLLEPATGHPFDSLGVVKASITNNLLELLGKAIEQYKVKEGKPLVKPRRQVFPSSVTPDSLVLHLVARDLGFLKPGPVVPRARDCNVGSWREYPAENSIVLEKAEWSKLAPPPGATTWKVPEEIASKILSYFYPQVEANVVSNHRVNDGALKASVVSTAKGIVRVRLDGTLSLKRVQEPNAVFVEAPLSGYYDYDPARRRIVSFRLLTESAKCGSRSFGVAVRSVAPEELTATAPSK